MIEGKSNGQIAFEAYSASVGGLTFDGRPIPQWDELGLNVQAGWEAAAEAVMPKEPAPDVLLNERETLLVDHALFYAKRFHDAGAPGHNQFMLIAKLAKKLGWPPDGVYWHGD